MTDDLLVMIAILAAISLILNGVFIYDTSMEYSNQKDIDRNRRECSFQCNQNNLSYLDILQTNTNYTCYCTDFDEILDYKFIIDLENGEIEGWVIK